MILAITPGDGRDLRPWIDALSPDAWLIREPAAAARDLAALAARARARCDTVWIHDKNPAARALVASEPAFGLYLPGGGVAPAFAGRSCHTAEEVEVTLAAGAFAVLSPVWRPASKPLDGRAPLGPDRFVAIAAGRAVLALGGVTPARWHALRLRRVRGVAVLGALFGADSAAEAGKRLQTFR